ncbi:MAG: NADH-quinone oxidoreductase subunit NuoG [Candidatus Hydrogenedentes bacterium]|nr:NADH-quinone oxidoreductase subunit NuoG [Candidatus Hydrogenedentota bacterium]
MATIYVDNKPYVVNEGRNLLQVCLSLGFNLPYFCWHPALGSVGACRQCAVKQFKDEKDKRGKIVMACMTPAAEGVRIAVDDEEARQFRETVIEWLMANHPHDCPVCDEGGECHLQDMTVMTGHNYRKYRFPKRTYQNQYLGPFINHEMNRCIQCYRCVRFYQDYAGGQDLGVFAAHDRVYFGRHKDGVLENEFSGNLVELCPTGVFTDKTLKGHYTRAWDLQTAPSVCVHCGVGCNTTPGERYGLLRRIHNRFNHDVNGYFLCDRGRYGYEFVNGERRVRTPLLKRDGALGPVTRAEALTEIGKVLSGPAVLLGIGSPRASIESNFALRELVGPDRFYDGVSARERQLLSAMLSTLRAPGVHSPSLREVGEADAVFVLGENLAEVAPMIALQVRQAVYRSTVPMGERLGIPAWHDSAIREAIQGRHGPLYLATVTGDKLADVATRSWCAAPDDLARLGFAVAHCIDPTAPSVSDLSEELPGLAKEIAGALRSAQRPLIVSGPSCGSLAVVQAAANVAISLSAAGAQHAALCYDAPECNSFGPALLDGHGLDEALQAAKSGSVYAAIVLENDLYRRADRAAVDAFLEGAEQVVVIDHTVHDTTKRADVVLPAATFAEGDGTLVNNEGRAQRFVQVFKAQGDVQESWRWLGELSRTAPSNGAWQNLDHICTRIAETAPALGEIARVAPAATARFLAQRIPRQAHRYSGRTAIGAHVNVHEPALPEDPDSPMAFSMEGFPSTCSSALTSAYWAPGWNSVQALNKFQAEVGGPLRVGNAGVRLWEVAEGHDHKYFEVIPPAFQSREKEHLAVPLHHIFGSEELSVLSPSVAERAPASYVAVNFRDAEALQITDGENVQLVLDGIPYRLPVRILPDLPSGVVGLPSGLPEMSWVKLPGWGKIVKEVPA